MNVPNADEIPPELRGTSAVVVKGCYCGPVSDGEALMSHWTGWKQPVNNAFAAMPFGDVASISQDPVDPAPAFAAGGDALTHLSDDAMAILIHYASTNGTTKSGSSPFLETEVRHVASEVIRAPRLPNAYSLRDARFVLDIVALAPTPERVEELRRYTAAFKRALRPHVSGDMYLNFSDPADARRGENGSSSERTNRLRAIKQQYDARGQFMSAHSLP